MRSLFLLSTIFAMIPVSWIRPQVGVLVWCWLAFMSPHRQIWGGGDAFRLNLILAIVTLLGFLFSTYAKKIPINFTTVSLALFVISTSLSAYFSLVPDLSLAGLNEYMKSFILLFLIIILMNNRVRIHAIIWIIVVSIGYYGVLGGLIGIISGGSTNFVGPPGSMISDNNHMALAMVITIPLMNYLRLNSARKLVRVILLVSMLLTMIAVLSTYSRGGFIGLFAMLAYLWARSSRKIITLIFAVIALVPMVIFMPQKWQDRMGTIETASESDGSFQSRLAAWETNFNFAVSYPILGAGLKATEVSRIYMAHRPVGDKNRGRAAHSIYFQILGGQGFVGLTIYLFLLYSGWRNSSIVIRVVERSNGQSWARDLAKMSQVSLVGFGVAGAALSMAFYDVLLTIVILQSPLRTLVETEARNLRMKNGAVLDNRPLEHRALNKIR